LSLFLLRVSQALSAFKLKSALRAFWILARIEAIRSIVTLLREAAS
jgi:hypothetical protein